MIKKTKNKNVISNKMSCDEVTINGEKYIREKIINIKSESAKKLRNMKYVLIRTRFAGVFTGYLKRQNGKEVELINARRIYYWEGAMTLSQLSMEGTKLPEKCKFPCEINNLILTGAIEIIECTEKARKSIASVPIWAWEK